MCNLDIWIWVTKIGENLACKLFFGSSSLTLMITRSGYALSSPWPWPRVAFLNLISLSRQLKKDVQGLAYLLVPQVNNSALTSFASGFVSLTVELYRSKAVYPSKSLREVSTSERCKKSSLHGMLKSNNPKK